MLGGHLRSSERCYLTLSRAKDISPRPFSPRGQGPIHIICYDLCMYVCVYIYIYIYIIWIYIYIYVCMHVCVYIYI